MLVISLLGFSCLFAGLPESRHFFSSVAPSHNVCRFLCHTFSTCGDTAGALSKAAAPDFEVIAAGDLLHVSHISRMSQPFEKSTIPLFVSVAYCHQIPSF